MQLEGPHGRHELEEGGLSDQAASPEFSQEPGYSGKQTHSRAPGKKAQPTHIRETPQRTRLQSAVPRLLTYRMERKLLGAGLSH